MNYVDRSSLCLNRDLIKVEIKILQPVINFRTYKHSTV